MVRTYKLIKVVHSVASNNGTNNKIRLHQQLQHIPQVMKCILPKGGNAAAVGASSISVCTYLRTRNATWAVESRVSGIPMATTPNILASDVPAWHPCTGQCIAWDTDTHLCLMLLVAGVSDV